MSASLKSICTNYSVFGQCWDPDGLVTREEFDERGPASWAREIDGRRPAVAGRDRGMTKKNKAAVSLGRLGGRVRSEAKTQAARANGKKGGRPRHVKTCAICGAFIPLAKEGERIVVCPKCGTGWQ